MRASGQGCVVDAAITDIAAMIGSLAQVAHAAGTIGRPRPSPSTIHPSTMSPLRRRRAITLGALEPQFYRLLLESWSSILPRSTTAATGPR